MKPRIFAVWTLLAVSAAWSASCSSKSKPVQAVPVQKADARKEQAPRIEKPRTEAVPSKRSLPVIATEDLAEAAGQEKNGISEKEEAAVILEEALALYQEAQGTWENGDLDASLDKLDEAYSLILKAKMAPDSPLCQEKNDLRLLIAQRIQQIYASRLRPVGSNNKTIPLVDNKWVQSEIQSFQTRERKYFEESYKRSGLYRPMILEELKKAGLPEELSWLPFIESGFKIRALSKARALGLWQFIASTGYRFGLKRDKYVDERMDALKSTQAAIKYLEELHVFFGDWTTALASYNCGEMRVQNVIRAQKIDYMDNFWDLFTNLPYETARFVPRLIAVLLIIENPEKYGFTLPAPDPPLDFETVAVNYPVKLASLASSLALDHTILSFLNSELRHDSTPDREYQLRVPLGYGEKTMSLVTSLPRWVPPDVQFGWHTVKRGDTLGAIARRYRSTVDGIRRLNGLRGNIIRPGQRLKIPGRGGNLQSADTESSPPASPAPVKQGEKITYVVRNGDTLFQLARMFNTTVDKIKQENGLGDDMLNVGQRLVIQSGKAS